MHPLELRASARHRREPSVRQRIRASAGALAALAVIAAFGVFTGTFASGQTWQSSLTQAGPAWLIAWLSCALPLAGLFGMVVPTRLARLRLGVSAILLFAGIVLAAAVSEPADPRFTQAQSAAAYALLVTLLLGAVGATLTIALDSRRDVLLKLRRSVMWAGPLTLAATFAAAVSA